jgi:hypothetical protein
MSTSTLIPSVLTSPDPELLKKYLDEEKEYGIDYEQLEKTYYFKFEESETVTNSETQTKVPSFHKHENIFIHPSYITPSQKTQMTPTEEYNLRILGAQMIKEAGYSLRLPWYSILTGQNIFHRFYTR